MSKRSKRKTKSRYCKHNLFCVLLWQNWAARVSRFMKPWTCMVWANVNFRIGRYVLDYLPIWWYLNRQKFISTWFTYLFDHMHEKMHNSYFRENTRLKHRSSLPLINILMVPESKLRKRHYWLIFKLPWRYVVKIQCNGLVFFFIMTHERMHERQFASESVMWLDVVALNAV